MTDETTTELRNRSAAMWESDDSYVRLRWQASEPAPAVLIIGHGAKALAYGLSAAELYGMAAALSEMARVIA